MQNHYQKVFLDIKMFNCQSIFKIFAAHFRTKLVLNIDKNQRTLKCTTPTPIGLNAAPDVTTP